MPVPAAPVLSRAGLNRARSETLAQATLSSSACPLGAVTVQPSTRPSLVTMRCSRVKLLVNVLLGFGVVAVAVGCLLLVPNSVAGVMLGGVLMATGLGLFYARPSRMGTVGQHLHSRGGAASGRGNHAA